MRAVTLHRPWPWAIFCIDPANEPKDLENRTWHPPPTLIGQRIAIHAGKVWDPHGFEFIRRLGYDCPYDGDDHPRGIIGTVRLTGTMGPIETTERHRALFSKWYMGRVGWLIADPVKLESPLTCSGRQKFWNVPPELTEELTQL